MSVEDDERPGQPITSIMTKNVEKIQVLITTTTGSFITISLTPTEP
jgi:hypothetical protein